MKRPLRITAAYHDEFLSTMTPIWTSERGKRLKLARMSMLMDQRELGRRLGLSQKTICNLEKGVLRVPQTPFSLADLHAAFEGDADHILFILSGLFSSNYRESEITQAYWHKKLEPQRKKKGVAGLVKNDSPSS